MSSPDRGKTMKIVTVVGARPQFVKAAAVSRVIRERPAVCEVIVHTGQHYDTNMSDVFFEEMEIPRPAYHLEVHGGMHGAMTGQMLEKVEAVLLRERPDALLVYGDTNSTLAGALAAAKLHIPVAHVEAGLRSFNRRMPEEINRIMTDHVSDWLFCPTDQARANLQREGVAESKIFQPGDVMQDAALHYAQLSEQRSRIVPMLGLKKPWVLATVHRAENTDSEERLTEIMRALAEIARDQPVVLPLHPRTRQRLQAGGVDTRGIFLIDPVGYFDMIQLIRGASLVMTDSGGLQKEAFFFGKACVTLREETEWVELVEQGVNRLAGWQCPSILEAFRLMSGVSVDAGLPLYGGGQAARRIVEILCKA
jgi:UDP-GlcNAc3NAcA epimerase